MIPLAMSAGEKKIATLSPVFRPDNSIFVFFLNYPIDPVSIGHLNQETILFKQF